MRFPSIGEPLAIRRAETKSLRTYIGIDVDFLREVATAQTITRASHVLMTQKARFLSKIAVIQHAGAVF